MYCDNCGKIIDELNDDFTVYNFYNFNHYLCSKECEDSYNTTKVD